VTGSKSNISSDRAAARRKAAILVAACTVFNAAAQLLFKIGMNPGHFVPSLMGLATDVPLIGAFALYGVFTVAMVLALREGELSMLYPIIALSYVWVTLASYWLLHDTPNLYKNLGVVSIVVGVAVLGGGGRQK
jgi:drug/metabolite transporter (DMT)-like permease